MMTAEWTVNYQGDATVNSLAVSTWMHEKLSEKLETQRKALHSIQREERKSQNSEKNEGVANIGLNVKRGEKKKGEKQENGKTELNRNCSKPMISHKRGNATEGCI